MRSILSAVLYLGLLISFAGCSDPSDSQSSSGPAVAPETRQNGRTSDPAVASLINAQSTGFCAQTKSLQQAVTAFLDNPSPETLNMARDQWRQAHSQLAQLATAYQLTGITMPQIHDDRDPVDAHPMLPGYLDQVPGYPQSGLVYSEVPMTPAFLRGEHQSTDFYYLTLGFHPLETMLWGTAAKTDKQRAALYRPSTKPADDQVDARSRRVDLLRLIAHALTQDATELCSVQQMQITSMALTDLESAPEKLSRSVVVTLKNLVRDPLEAWQKHPDGEDRNGMPISHSPLAHTDFAEIKTQLASLTDQWLPLLLPTPRPEWANALEPALKQAAAPLTKPDKGSEPPSAQTISEILDRLNQIQARLSPSPGSDARSNSVEQKTQ